MGLPVREALQVGGLKKASLIAGQGGLDNQITSVSVIEVPDAYLWFRGGELFLSAFYTLKDDPEAQVRMVEKLAGSGSAALIICYPGLYVKDIPDAAIGRADELRLPLLTLPNEVAYIEVISPVLAEIQARSARKLQLAMEIHEKLTRSILAGRGLQDLVSITAQLVQNPVFLFDQLGHCLADAAPPAAEPAQARLRAALEQIGQVLRARLAARQPGEIALAVDGVPIRCIVEPVSSGGACHGALVMAMVAGPVSELMTVALQQACTGIALELVKEEAVRQARQENQRQLLDELFSGRPPNSDDLVQRARAFGWDIAHKRAVLVVDRGANADALQAAAAAAGGGHLAVGWSGRTLLLVDAAPDEPAAAVVARSRSLAHTVAQQAAPPGGFPPSVGIGSTVAGPGELWQSYREASQTLRLGQELFGPGSTTHVEDLGALYLLQSCVESDEARRVVQRVLAPLLDYDRENGTDLLGTLEQLYQADGRAGAVSRQLYMHRNTLHYRKRKIAEILGYHPFVNPHRFNLQVALTLRRLLR